MIAQQKTIELDVCNTDNYTVQKIELNNTTESFFDINTDTPRFQYFFIILIQGSINIQVGKQKYYQLNSKEFLLLKSFNTNLQAKILSNTSIKFYMISCNEEFFTENADLENKILENLYHSKKSLALNACINNLTPSNIFILSEIEQCNYLEFYKQRYLQLKFHELFLSLIQQTAQSVCNKTCQLKNYQIEKIRDVRNIIETKIKESCSLLQLSKEVGLNDCTLKKGFKELYKTTVFGYLFDLRMNKAVELLKEDNLSVNEIAEEIGYRNPSNFISAFKKRFGTTPQKFIK